jgi:hypothetical protein
MKPSAFSRHGSRGWSWLPLVLTGLALVACSDEPDANDEPLANGEPDANGALLGTEECAMTADGGCSDPCFPVRARHVDLDAGCQGAPVPVTCSKAEGGSGAEGCSVHLETGELYLVSSITLWEPYYHGWSASTQEQYQQAAVLPMCE